METVIGNRIEIEELLRLFIRLKKFLRRFGLTTCDYQVLLLVRETPGIKPGKIITETEHLPAYVSRVLGHLEEMELIKREIGEDKRTNPLSLTERGVLLLERIAKLTPRSL